MKQSKQNKTKQNNNNTKKRNNQQQQQWKRIRRHVAMKEAYKRKTNFVFAVFHNFGNEWIM